MRLPGPGVHRDQPGDTEPGSGAVYNKRGTAEQWIKEGKQAVKMTRLSCHRFRSNQVRLALRLLAYNLGNLWRRVALPKRIEKRAADELAATAGEDGRTGSEIFPLLLAD